MSSNEDITSANIDQPVLKRDIFISDLSEPNVATPTFCIRQHAVNLNFSDLSEPNAATPTFYIRHHEVSLNFSDLSEPNVATPSQHKIAYNSLNTEVRRLKLKFTSFYKD